MWGLTRKMSATTRYNENSDDESPYHPALQNGSEIDSSFDGSPEQENANVIPHLHDAEVESSEEEDSDLEADEALQRLKEKGKGKKKKSAGRKATWSLTELEDLVDVICSNDDYRRKIIFTNNNQKNRKNSDMYSEIIKEVSD